MAAQNHVEQQTNVADVEEYRLHDMTEHFLALRALQPCALAPPA
jgi:hypothetical protein